jgi:hypothetical protein
MVGLGPARSGRVRRTDETEAREDDAALTALAARLTQLFK